MKSKIIIALLLFAATLQAQTSVHEGRSVELGTRFHVTQPGIMTAVKFLAPKPDIYTVKVYANGLEVYRLKETITVTGTHYVTFPMGLEVQPDVNYIVSYHNDSGNYTGSWKGVTFPKVNNHFQCTAGLYYYGTGIPRGNSGGWYWIEPQGFPIDAGVVNIYVPRNGGWALTESSDTAYKALFGVFPPPDNSPKVYQFKYGKYRLTLFKNGAWIRELGNEDGSFTKIPY